MDNVSDGDNLVQLHGCPKYPCTIHPFCGSGTTSRSGSNVQSIQPNVAAVQTDGANAYRSGRFTEAATLYQTACSLDPSNAVHWSNLAAAQIALGQYAAAMDAAHKGLACARVSTEVNKKLRMRLGRAAFYAREYKTSVDALSSVEVLHASTKSLLKAATLRLKSASKCACTSLAVPVPSARGDLIITHTQRYNSNQPTKSRPTCECDQ